MPGALHLLHGVATVLLTFFGASVGAVAAAREPTARPELMEVLLPPAVAAAVLVVPADLNRWLVLVLAMVSGIVLTSICRTLIGSAEYAPRTVGHRSNASDAQPSWRRFLHAVGSYQSRLALSLFYFTLVAPFALIARLSQDPLGLNTRETGDSHWRGRDSDRDDLSRPY